MKTLVFLLFAGLFLCVSPALAAQEFENDVIKTSGGDLTITFLGHGSVAFEFGGKTLHVDPFGQVADYTQQPKADLILVTHEHPDHFDLAALSAVRTPDTKLILTKACAEKVSGGDVMGNGDKREVFGIGIEAVPAYNLVHMREDGQPFHPRGRGNGYILTFGDKRVYVAGDTENIPEMKALKDIDVAFLPMNLPFTMTPEMVADAAKAFKPKILYPYHTGTTDLAKIVELMKDAPEVEVLLRRMR
jgi:L-ascorbate metabolism protein UlaG (beta-lactamase superfamily)